ncbi:restriction endonuclease subunit S [Holzapfeliella sp. JNUCC 80]
MNKEKLVPQLRFKGFEGEWEKKKFRELADIKRGASPRPIKDPKWFDKNSDIGWLRISDVTKQNGKVSYIEQRISNLGAEKTRVLTTSHLILSIAATIGEPAINYVKTGVHDGFLIFYNPKFELMFGFQWLRYFKSFWQQYGQPGSQVNLNSDIVNNQDVILPLREEQQKIGSFFEKMDKLIELYRNQLKSKKLYKKGLLQKSFPIENQLLPRIRFENFKKNWKYSKVSELVIERNDKVAESSNYPLMSFVQNIGVVPKSDRYNREFLVKSNSKKYKRTLFGDFIYSSNNLDTGSIGFNNYGNAVISPVYSIFYSNNHLDSKFVGRLFLRSDFIAKMIRYRQGVVYGQWRIHEKDFLNIKVSIPTDDEKIKIIDLFDKLDQEINLYEQKIEQLKQLKKGYLQKLFC